MKWLCSPLFLSRVFFCVVSPCFFMMFAASGSAAGQSSSTPVINCPSGFASSGTCGVGAPNRKQPFAIINGGANPGLSGSSVLLIPTGETHAVSGFNYQTQVNAQAFTASFTFVPNGQNVAFVIQNSNNNPYFNGADFNAGAGCEAGFFQAFQAAPPNNVFALELDSYSPLTLTGLFTYSSAQIYQSGQSPCLPNDGGPNYLPINKISTSPVNLTTGSRDTTTGDTYSVNLSYNGSTLVMDMYDVTAGGACPGSRCFTHTWNDVEIPTWVGGDTAWVGFTAATGLVSKYPLYIQSFVYTPISTTGGTPTAATPVFSVASGTYASGQTVAISDATAGATIYYTTDGTTPTTSSQQYSSPITVSSSETIQAIAVAGGYENSAVATATYVIDMTLPGFSVSGSSVTVSPGATSGNTSTISITPSNGFTGSVALTAFITASPSGATNLPTLSFGSTTPANVSSGSAATATLTISTTAATSAAVPAQNPGRLWCLTGGTALACFLLCGLSAVRRKWQARFGALVLAMAFLGGISACNSDTTNGGSGGSGGGTGTGSPGTTAGTYTITVTGTSGSLTETGMVTLVVN